MAKRSGAKVDWKSAWNQWPKPVDEMVTTLRAAVRREKAPGKKTPPTLRDAWVQMIMAVNNAAQKLAPDASLWPLLRSTFEGEAQASLVRTIAAQADLVAAAKFAPEWIAGPFGAAKLPAAPWLTPFHPGIELAVYARLLTELGEAAAGRDLLAGLHLQLRAMMNATHDDPEWGAMARAQVLAGWRRFLESGATTTFGFADVEAWARHAAEAANAAPTHDLPPSFDDAFRALTSR